MLIVTLILFSIGFVYCFSSSVSYFIKACSQYRLMIGESIYSFNGYYILSVVYFIASLVIVVFIGLLICLFIKYKKDRLDK